MEDIYKLVEKKLSSIDVEEFVFIITDMLVIIVNLLTDIGFILNRLIRPSLTIQKCLAYLLEL